MTRAFHARECEESLEKSDCELQEMFSQLPCSVNEYLGIHEASATTILACKPKDVIGSSNIGITNPAIASKCLPMCHEDVTTFSVEKFPIKMGWNNEHFDSPELNAIR